MASCCSGIAFCASSVCIAIQVDVRIIQQRLIANRFAFGLIDDGLVGPRVDLDQRFALLHQVAFFEMDAHQLPVDAALDGDRVDGSHAPSPVT